MEKIKQKDLFSASTMGNSETTWFSDALQCMGITEDSGWPDKFGDELLLWHDRNSKRNIRTLSLFSGGGGLDIGFHDAGFNIIECNEIVPAFAATLEKNARDGGRISGARIVCKDINDYNPDLKDIDFIVGGPPCQTFSAAGARAAGVNGTDDQRGNLFLQYARLIYKLQPKGFLFENVYRIVGAQSGKPWKQIQESFEELGYKLFWRILDAADYGTPQFRERLIIVGLKHGEFEFPFPSHGPDSGDQRAYYNAQLAIKNVKNSVIPRTLGGRHGYLLNDIPPGLNYSFYTERMGHPTPIFAWRSKFSDYLYKADPNTPVRTIKAQGGQYTGPFSWENRPFTVEELKRLQTFPDDYSIEGKRQIAIHQLGNSVPPQFARILALSIMKQVFKEKVPFDIKLMPSDFNLGFRTRKSQLTNVYSEKAKKAIKMIPAAKQVELHPIDGQEYFSVDSDLRIQTSLEKNEAKYHVKYGIKNDIWSIHISHARNISKEIKYKININHAYNAAFKAKINLSSSLNDEHSLIAIWKILEFLLKKFNLKDDLIQLFGYYQYKSEYSFDMVFNDQSMCKSSYWETAKNITQGLGVGTILSYERLANELGCSTDEIKTILPIMKDLGYEIRNHNTNRQIQKGMVLIPYSFPTLNERSLQRLTSL